MSFGRNDAKAETPVLWPPHAKCWLTGKDSDAGRDWGQEEKGTTEDEMAGWHHQLDGREFQWTPGVGDGQGGLACCNSWGRKELDTTEWLNWTEQQGLAHIMLIQLQDLEKCDRLENSQWFKNMNLLSSENSTCEMSYISQVTLWGYSCELCAAFLQGEFGAERLPYDFFRHELSAQ